MSKEIENKLKQKKVSDIRKKRIKRIIWIVVIIAIIILGFMYYQDKKNNTSMPWDDTTKNATQEDFSLDSVRQELYKNKIDISGYVEPWDIQEVNFRSSGAITLVLVKEGDTVKEGQLLATIDDTNQQYNLASIENQIAKTKLTGNKADLELMEMQKKICQTDLDYTKVTAAFDGVVVSVDFKVGDYIGAGTEVMKIIDNSKLEATVVIDEIDLQNVELGMKCNLTSDAIPGVNLEGIVYYIPMLGEYSNQGIGIMKVKIEIDQFPKAMKPGFSFEGKIESDTEQNLLIINQKAINSDSGQSFLSVKQADGTFKDVEITAKYLGEGVCQILSGDVNEGDQVKIETVSNDDFERMMMF